MGLMPLVIGMPMRCSDIVGRKRKFFKHARVKLIGLKLKSEDEEVVAVFLAELCALRSMILAHDEDHLLLQLRVFHSAPPS